MKKRKIRNDDDGCHAAADDELGRDDAYHPRRAFGSRAMTVDGRDSFAVKMDEAHFLTFATTGFTARRGGHFKTVSNERERTVRRGGGTGDAG